MFAVLISMWSKGSPRVITCAIVCSAVLSFLVDPNLAQAKTCTQRHKGCVDACMRMGIGSSRSGGVTRPMPADVCEAHCIGWTTECKRTGCFSGDLKQE